MNTRFISSERQGYSRAFPIKASHCQKSAVTETKSEFTVLPRLCTATTIATAIPLAMIAYSIDVAADSAAKKPRILQSIYVICVLTWRYAVAKDWSRFG